MSMTEAPAAPAKPKRTYKRKAKQAIAEKPSEFAGITARNCCNDCTEKRCVITTVAMCGHPNKTNIPGAGPKTLARIAEVKKLIAHQKIEAA